MATKDKKKFSSQMNSELFEKARKIAEVEGKLFQTILEEGIKKVIEDRESKGSLETMDHFKDSLKKNYELGKLLAQ